ncbi:MAG: EAL domain-containing protein, partial [Actinoplanes sp.]
MGGTWADSARRWIPSSSGLRDEDWAGRHRLLTVLLAATMPVLIVLGVLRDGMTRPALITVLLVLVCVLGAVRLRPRRLPSMFVAFGFTVACAGFVTVCSGVTESHFAFFVAVAALALYRDWAPFGMFLIATVLHHAVFGVLMGEHTYQTHDAMLHPWLWAGIHGAAVLAAAAFQVIGWRLTESEEQRARENLEDSQAQLGIAFDQSPVPMAMFSPEGLILRTNPAYRSWLGLPDVLPPGMTVRELPLSPVEEGVEPLFDMVVRAGGKAVVARQYRRHDDGSVIWVEVHSAALYDSHGRLRLIYANCIDVTLTRRHQDELQQQVRHDGLTGLLSRKGFEADLVTLLDSYDGPLSLLYLDVDRFKSINDGAGHGAGDVVLRTLAARITANVPRGSLVARLGGDEFVVALPGGPEWGQHTGQALLAASAEPIPLNGGRIQLEMSIGLTVTAGGGTAEDIVLAADTAMYAAKRAGGNRVELFDEQMRVGVREKVAAEARLRAALSGNKVETLPIWFQPVVSPVDGRIVGAEALVRMRTPDGRILAPGQFIGAAEETGLVVPLGEHVLRRALIRLRQWSEQLGYISVNVSPRQLAEPNFVPMLSALLAEYPDIDPARLVLEITETAMLSSSGDIEERLRTIKTLGVRIALDDFGTGYSSLTWLQTVPADVVKLDRSFVAGLARDPRKASIISAVLWLARSLGMSVIAEGVEEGDDWDALRESSYPVSVQGYYISRPLPPDT